MQKGVSKGTDGNYGGIGGRCLGHRTGRRKKLQGIGNAIGTGGRDLHPVAPLVIHGAAQVPTIDTVGISHEPLV